MNSICHFENVNTGAVESIFLWRTLLIFVIQLQLPAAHYANFINATTSQEMMNMPDSFNP
jgi:hypothetical protein